MRKALRLTSVLCILYAVAAPSDADEVPSTEGDASLEVSGLEVVLRSGSYRFIEGREGSRIEMNGFDYLKEPGRPMLPERESLVLLPPGARALSLEVEELGAEPLAGTHRIAPTPPLLPLAGPAHSANLLARVMEKWKETSEAAYQDDRAYPAEVARIAGTGTLRKYSYVRIAYRPFTYRAVSGRLVRRDAARVLVNYALPDPAKAEALLAERLLEDTVADERAARLFVNYDDLKGLYQPERFGGAQPKGPPSDHDDYVIVTTEALEDAVAASGFPAWKTSLGFDVRTVLTSDPEICARPGGDLAEQIRNFLRDRYTDWGIQYVLLAGNEGVPMRLCFPDPDNHWHIAGALGLGSVPTDAYYADLSSPDANSWDLDGDGFYGEFGHDAPDFLPEVYVGRIPTDDPARVAYTLEKLIRVEQDTGAWKRRALHAGAVLFYENQDRFGTPFRDGAVVVDRIEREVMGGWTVSRYSEQAGLVHSTYSWPALNHTVFTREWRHGAYGVVNWAGHGSPEAVWRVIWMGDDGDGVPETNGSDWFDDEAFIGDWSGIGDDHPSIVFAVSCYVGNPGPNGSGNLGIDLLTNPALGGAAGVVSATQYAVVTSAWPALPGGAESMCYEFNRHLIAGPGGPQRLGAALHDSKHFCHVRYGWESHNEYRNMYDYNLYGDPSMDWRGAGLSADLLRNREMVRRHPMDPPLDDVLPLDPVQDLYIPSFAPGDIDPQSTAGCPLVFYALDASMRLRLAKTPAGQVRIDF